LLAIFPLVVAISLMLVVDVDIDIDIDNARERPVSHEPHEADSTCGISAVGIGDGWVDADWLLHKYTAT
jgi:hypothetical protein